MYCVEELTALQVNGTTATRRVGTLLRVPFGSRFWVVQWRRGSCFGSAMSLFLMVTNVGLAALTGAEPRQLRSRCGGDCYGGKGADGTLLEMFQV